MTTAEIIRYVIDVLFVSGVFVMLVTIRSTIKTAKANAQEKGTDANDKLMKSYEEHILNPILGELKELRAEREANKKELEELRKEREVYRQELAGLRAELEASRKAREASEEREKERTKLYERTNRKLDRLSRAIEKIPDCDYARHHLCPVSSELRKSAADSTDEGSSQD